MTPRNKKSTATPTSKGTNDSLRWIFGLLLLFFGLFSIVAIFFSYFYWTTDQSLFNGAPFIHEQTAKVAANPCGGFGAWLGWWLVDRTFGVFGILLPVICFLIGLRIIQKRPIGFTRSLLSLALVCIVGSITFGFLLPHWQVVASTGLGGAFGIATAEYLTLYIGKIGMVILLLTAWILIGVFINRNFIYTVNSAGNAMKNRSEKIVEIVKGKVVNEEEVTEQKLQPGVQIPEPMEEQAYRQEQSAEFEIAQAEEMAPVEPQPTISADSVPHKTRESVENHPLSRHPQQPTASFEIITKGDEKAESEEPKQEDKTLEAFTEINVGTKSDRVVMGANGLIELQPSTPATSTQSEPTSPFTEIDVTEEEAKRLANPNATPLFIEKPDTSKEAGNLVEEEQEPLQEEPLSSDDAPFTEIDQEKPSEEQPSTPPQQEEEGIVVDVEEHEVELMGDEQIKTETYDPLKDLVNYRKPSVELLEDYQSVTEVTNEEIFENKTRIEETLKYFGIPIRKIKATVGPTVTLYEIVQAQGVKISKIQGLENDIAQSLKALGIRIIAPIPGKGTIGIEVPNQNKQVVSMYSAIRSVKFQESKAALPIVIGRTIQNENYVFDLAKLPHLLVAGATGQGKSVGLNAIITSLLYRKHPAQLKFVLIDPKMVEFSLYAKIEKHFLAKMESEDEAIITDPQKAVYTLNSLCMEMDTRLELCKKAGTRNIAEYNQKFINRRLNPQKGHRYLPYIVVVVDEFADLIMTAREVEAPVMRLAQKARAIGIHLIIATQRPDVKVITGGIKANFPARMAFRVMQMIDSRTIIDQPGANQLIGRGDMLFSNDGQLTRIQCALVETEEVERVVDYISKQQGYTDAYLLPDFTPESSDGGLGSEDSAPVKYDPLFAEVARDLVASGQISTSMIQRNYEVGFNRAGRIMLQLERSGIVGPAKGAKPRDILIHDTLGLEAKLQDLGVF